MARRQKRDNIYFRQTPREFRAAKQTSVFAHINRNLPFRVYNFSKKQFDATLLKLRTKFRTSLPKYVNSRKKT